MIYLSLNQSLVSFFVLRGLDVLVPRYTHEQYYIRYD